jgi:hypothetical protein
MEHFPTARALGLILSVLSFFAGQASAASARLDQRSAYLIDTRTRALAGDGVAAYELAHFWLKESDGGSYRFYLRLAAELGSCVAVAEYRKLHRSEQLLAPDDIPAHISDLYAACRTGAEK